MSQNVENKVVEFQFNNKDFEKNVATSMSTLDKLKSALNFDGALKGFDNLDRATKNFDLSSMDKSVETTGSKFSALEAIALGALMRIGQQAVDVGGRVIKAFTIDQVAAGFDKYSEKVQAVATMYATGKYSMQEIEDSLANLNEYTDRTSYSFSTLVDNMSKFTAAGVELKDAELSMEGIGNWAALSGITAASGKVNIMAYNLSQAMSTGALLLQDFKSIENVNAATEDFKKNLIDAGLAMGTLTREGDKVVVTGTDIEVTYTNLRNTLQKRWVNDKVMLYTFQQYADETTEIGKRALAAAAEARTFEDALGAVNDAVSTSWMQTEEMIFGDYKEATKFWTGLQDYVLALFDKTMTARNELLRGALQNNSWKELDKTFESLNTSSKTFEERIKDAARSHGIAIDEMIRKQGSLEEVIKSGVFNAGFFAEVVDDYTNEIIRSAMAIDTEEGALSSYEKTVRAVLNGEYGDFIEARRILNAEGEDANAILEEANRRLSDHSYGLDSVTDAQLEAIGVTRDQYRGLKILSRLLRTNGTDFQEWGDNMAKISGRQLLIDSFYNVLESLVDVIERVSEAWKKIFPPLTAEQLYNALVAFEKLTDSMHLDAVEGSNLTRTFEGLFAIIDIIRIMITDVFSVAIDLLSSLFGGAGDSILEFTGDLGTSIVGIRDWIRENDPFLKVLQSTAEVIKGVVGWVKNLIDSFLNLPKVQEALGWIATQAGLIRDKFVKWAESAQPIQNGFEWIATTATNAYNAVKSLIEQFLAIPEVQQFIEKFKDVVSSAWGSVVEFFTNNKLVQSIKDIVDNFDGFNKIDLSGFKAGVVDIFDKVKDTFFKFWESLKDMADNAGPIFQKIGEWVRTFIGDIGEMWNAVKEFVGDHLGQIISLVITGTFAIGIIKIANAVLNITRALEGFGGALRGIGKAAAGWGMGKALGGVADIFKGIAAMLGAITIMTSVTTPEELDNAVNVMMKLVGLVGVIAIVIGAMDLIGTLSTNKVNKAANQGTDPKKIFSGVGDLMSSWLEIAGSMIMLASALKTIADIPEDSIKRAMTFFTLMLGELVGAALILNHWGGDFKTGSLSFIAFAGSVILLAGALAKIAVLPIDQLLAGFGALTLIVTEIILLSLASSKMDTGSAAGILAIGITLELVANVMKKIAKMEWEDILKSMMTITLIFAELTIIVAIMGRIDMGSMGIERTGLVLLEMAGSLILIAAAMKLIASVPTTAIVMGGIVFTTFIAEFIAALAILKHVDAGGGAAGTILAIGVSLLAMAGAMKLMANIPAADVAKGVLALDGLMAGIMGVVWASRGASNAMTTILAMAGAIGVLAIAIAGLSFIPVDHLTAATLAIDSVMVAMAIFVKSTEHAGSGKKTLVILAEMVGALTAVAGIMLLLGDMAPEDAIARAGGLSLLLVALSGATYILSQSGEVNKTAMAAAAELSALMLLMAAAILILHDMNPIDVLADAAALAILVESVASATYILGKAGEPTGMALAAAGELSLLMTVMAAVLLILKNCDPVGSIANATALGILMNLMATAVVILGEADAPSKTALLAAAELSALMLILGTVITMMDGMDVVGGLAAALSLGLLVNAMAAAVLILGKAGEPSAQALLAMAALTLVVAALAVILGVMDSMNVTANIETATALSILLVAMAVVTDILSVVGPVAGAAVMGAVALDGVVLAIIALFGTLGLLEQWTKGGLSQTIEAGIKLLDIVITGLAKIFADVIVTVLDTIASALPAIGTKLSLFALNIQPFLIGIKMVDEDAVKGVGNLALLILAIAAAEIIKAIADWVTGGDSIVKFGQDIAKLAPYLAIFGMAMRGVSIDPGTVDAFKTLADLILVLTVNDVIAGLTNWITGGTSIQDFCNDIVPLGKAMQEYSDAITAGSGINNTAVEASAKGAKALAEVADAMVSEGGLLQKIVGTKISLEDFGDTIVPFGEAMVEYSDAVSGISDEGIAAISTSAQAATELADLADKMQTKGGLLQDLIGTVQSLGDFGKDVKKFGESLVETTQVEGITSLDIGVFTKMKLAGLALTKVAEALPSNGTFWSWLDSVTNGDVNLETFGDTLKPFGQGLMDFQNAVEGLDSSRIDEVTLAAQKLVGIGTAVGTEELTGIASICQWVSSLGTSISTYWDNVSDIRALSFNQVTTALKYLAEFFGDISGLSSDGVGAMTDGINNLAKASIADFIENWRGGFEDVKTAGQDMMLAYGEGAELKKDDLKKIFTRIIKDCLAEFEAYISQFKDAGYSTTKATQEGAQSNAAAVEDAYVDPIEAAREREAGLTPEFEKTAEEHADATIDGYESKQPEIETAAISGTEAAVTKLATYIPKFQVTAEAISDAYGNNLEGPGSDKINSEFVTPIAEVPSKIIAGKERMVNATATISKAYLENILSGKTAVDEKILGPIAGVIPLIKQKAPDMETAIKMLYAAIDAGMNGSGVDLTKLLASLDPSIIKNQYNEWYEAGEYVALGLKNGLHAKQYLVVNTVMAMGKAAIKELHYVLGEQSPSKIAEQAGVFFDLGLANGIEETSGDVNDAVWYVGDMAVNRMEKMLDGLDSDLSFHPVITPVMDLTNVQNGLWSMDSMLSDKEYQLNGSLGNASETARLMSGGRVDLTQQAISQLQDAINRMAGRTGTTNNNTFNIQGDDPEAIALEVSRILQTDVERTGAVWA